MQLLCKICVWSEHKAHSVAPLDIAAKRYRRSFQDEIRKIQESIQQKSIVLKSLQEELKCRTEENMKVLHDRQKALIRKTNEIFTELKEDINKGIVPYQKKLDDITNKMKSKDLIRKIGQHITNAPDWLVLQIMMEKEKELNDIIDTINMDIKEKEELNTRNFDEECKMWITRKYDHLVEDHFLNRVKGTMVTQKREIDLTILPRIAVTSQESVLRNIMGKIIESCTGRKLNKMSSVRKLCSMRDRCCQVFFLKKAVEFSTHIGYNLH